MASVSDQFMPKVDWPELRPTNNDYAIIKTAALEFARLSFDARQLKREALAWALRRLNADEVASLEEAEEWRFIHIGKYLHAINKGGSFDDDCMVWLDGKIGEVLVIGKKNLVEKQAIAAAKVEMPGLDPNLRDIRLGHSLAMGMEDLILTGVYPKDHESAYNVLFHSEASPTVLRNAVLRLEEFVAELNDFSDEEITEGFSSEKKWKASRQAYMGLLDIAQNFNVNSRTLRKAAKKRKKTGTKAVQVTEAVQFKKEHSELQLVSIDPSAIIGTKGLLVYNTKARKIGLYFAESDEGLQVRGTTIRGYDEEKSYQKTLRNPEQQVNSFRDATLKRCSIILSDNIVAKTTKMNGRLNEHIVIMKAWK